MRHLEQDHYAILGIAPNADEEQIRAAYRARARQRHPDLGGSAEQMTLVNNAYEVLRDPSSRMAYDVQRVTNYPQQDSFLPTRRASCSIEMDSVSHYTRRIWRLVLGADCCLFLGLYCVLVTMDPEVSRSSVQSSIAICAAAVFLSSAVVFLYRYIKASRYEGDDRSHKAPTTHSD